MPLNGEGKLRIETMILHNVDMLGAKRIGKMNCAHGPALSLNIFLIIPAKEALIYITAHG